MPSAGHLETLVFDVVKIEWSVATASPPSSITSNKVRHLSIFLSPGLPAISIHIFTYGLNFRNLSKYNFLLAAVSRSWFWKLFHLSMCWLSFMQLNFSTSKLIAYSFSCFNFHWFHVIVVMVSCYSMLSPFQNLLMSFAGF